MKLVYFTHSLASCWNHGNAHFLRGVLRELLALGHDIDVFEQNGAWSLENLVRDHGHQGLASFAERYPELSSTPIGHVDEALDSLATADVVIVHEWNEPDLVGALGRLRSAGGRFLLLFHDTHHRAVSDPEAIHRFDLSGFDGILAFGEGLAEIYRRWGWGRRVFVWHEAADTRLFRPPPEETERKGIVWIGNWGDEERSAELETYLFGPVAAAGQPLDVYGVRYTAAALDTLRSYGATYHGWLANPLVPDVFARHLATVHVPRRFYVDALPGIPTIRVFEALACGIPLVSAPWRDSEGLFRPGEDFLVARTGAEMEAQIRALAADRELVASLVASGLETIHARHSCARRAEELMGFLARLSPTIDLQRTA